MSETSAKRKRERAIQVSVRVCVCVCSHEWGSVNYHAIVEVKEAMYHHTCTDLTP